MNEIAGTYNIPLHIAHAEIKASTPLSGNSELSINPQVSDKPFAQLGKQEDNTTLARTVKGIMDNFELIHRRQGIPLVTDIDIGIAKVNGKTYDVDILRFSEDLLNIRIVEQNNRRNQIHITLNTKKSIRQVDISLEPKHVHGARDSQTSALPVPPFRTENSYHHSDRRVLANDIGYTIFPGNHDEYHAWEDNFKQFLAP